MPKTAKDKTLTPAMRQYHDVKKRHPEALLLFQMGDFYETFYDDAVKLAETLNITLTARGMNAVPSLFFTTNS